MANFSRILFVDEANTDLSVMAAALFSQLSGERPVEIDSRGLVVLFPEPVNAKAEAVLKTRGLKALSSQSRKLVPGDLNATTLILTMTESEKRTVLDQFPDANFVYTIREFAGEQGNMDVPYGPASRYEECCKHLSELCWSIAEILFA